MSLKKICTAMALIVTAAILTIACKNDEETSTSLPYLTGTPRFSVDRYVEAGSTHTITASEVTNSTGAEVSYTWSATRGSETMMSNQTTEEEGGRRIEFTFEGANLRDTLCDFTVTCSASATGYYGQSYSRTVTTVKDNSLTFEGNGALDPGIGTGSVTDARDGMEYGTISVNGLEWTADNMAYAGEDSSVGEPLESSEAVSGLFGRFYTWSEASAVCEGLGASGEWRLPTTDDWNVLGEYLSSADSQEGASGDGVWKGVSGKLMTNVYMNGERMWEYWPKVKITNESGFNVMPTGYATVVEITTAESTVKNWTFSGINEYAGFWTSTEETPEDGSESTRAYYIYIIDANPDTSTGLVEKTGFALPVRCVRNL